MHLIRPGAIQSQEEKTPPPRAGHRRRLAGHADRSDHPERTHARGRSGARRPTSCCPTTSRPSRRSSRTTGRAPAAPRPGRSTTTRPAAGRPAPRPAGSTPAGSTSTSAPRPASTRWCCSGIRRSPRRTRSRSRRTRPTGRPIYSTTTGTGFKQTLNGSTAPAATCGCTAPRGPAAYGYSLWEFQVYGTGGSPTTPPALPPNPIFPATGWS